MEWARVLEALLFAATEPMEPSRLATILRDGPEGGQGWPDVKEEEVREELTHLAERLAPRGLILREVAGGFRIGTAPDLSGWVAKLKGVVRPPRLSPPALETMAVIAYRQPISRAEIEAVRGVSVDGPLQTLMDRNVVRIAGRADLPGRPLLYETTELFLEHFGVRTIDDLPNAAELRSVKLPEPEAPAAEAAAGSQEELTLGEGGEAVAKKKPRKKKAEKVEGAVGEADAVEKPEKAEKGEKAEKVAAADEEETVVFLEAEVEVVAEEGAEETGEGGEE